MSAASALQAAVALRLASARPLVECAVFDAPPVRAALPHIVVGEPLVGDWSAACVSGREGRIAVTLHDAGERPVRLRALAEATEEAVLTIPPALAEGWRIVRLQMLRSRLQRGGGERWSAAIEFLVRMYREDA